MNTRALLAACLLVGACSADTGDAVDADARADSSAARASGLPRHFTVDSTAYTLRSEGDLLRASIGYVFRNTLADTVYVVNCNGHVVMDLHRHRGPDASELVLGGVTNGCLSPPLVIEPGDSLVGRMEIAAALPGHPNYPTFGTTDFDGLFTLVWHQPRLHYSSDAPNFGDTLSIGDRTSLPFQLRRPPGAAGAADSTAAHQ